MPRTQEELISAVQKSLQRGKRAAGFKRKVDALNVARKRSEMKFKRAFVERALRVLEFDAEAAKELQERDQASIVTFFDQAKREALEQASGRAKRQAAFVRAQLTRLAPAKKRPPGASEAQGIVIKTADRIVTDSPNTTTSIAPSANIAKVHLAASEQHSEWRFAIGHGAFNRTDWHFSWTAPGDGYMSYTALLLLNGTATLWSPISGCFAEGFADHSLSAHALFSTFDDSGQLSSTPAYWPPFNPLIARKVTRGPFDSAPPLDFVVIENQDLFPWTSLFPVRLNEPVLVTISMETELWCNNYDGEIDLATGSYGANVPFVLLKFQPPLPPSTGFPQGPLHR